MIVSKKSELLVPSPKVSLWLRIENDYQWEKFSVEEETTHLLESGIIGDSYWADFFGSRWSRFQLADKRVNPLRASHDLLKEAATAIALGVCLRYADGETKEDASSNAITAAGVGVTEYTRSELGGVLDTINYTETPMYLYAEQAHELILDPKGSHIKAATMALDQVIRLEAVLADHYIANTSNAEFPKPGFYSSQDAVPWTES